MNWVDLGTDVDWAQRTVEQMEKVFFVYFSAVTSQEDGGCVIVCCSTHLCRMMDMFVCCGQEIKMAEQRYSESSSSSSVSTMGVKLIKVIVAAMTMNLIMMCSSIKH